MGFEAFHGNTEVVARLREALARDRFPSAVIISGPRGSGKYTLAQMLAKAMNCLSPPFSELPDFCGRCANCESISQADDLDSRFEEAVEAREGLRETDKKETRIFVQTHPDVLIIPPDPPQMLIKVDQVRHVIGTVYHRPGGKSRRVYIFTDSAFMKEAANSLLKVLEEPPDFATLILLSQNPGELLPTIRSRCVTFTLAPLPLAEVEQYLAQHRPDWKPQQRALVARLSAGALGRARTFDLAEYDAARKDALTLLRSAMQSADHSALFRTTETYRAGAEGRDKTDALIRTLYTLLQDIVFTTSGTPDLIRNIDLQPELAQLARAIDFKWVSEAAQRLAEVEAGMRRNLLRNLSLDAFTLALQRD